MKNNYVRTSASRRLLLIALAMVANACGFMKSEPIKPHVTVQALMVRGGWVTLEGEGLGAERKDGVIRFGDVPAEEYLSWTDTQVVVRAPPTAPLYESALTLERAGHRTTASIWVLPQVRLSATPFVIEYHSTQYSWGHRLLVHEDGTVSAWGPNSYGQSNVPEGLSGVIAVAAGMFHSLALKEDGTVVAWGANEAHQSTVPEGLTGVVAIAAGEFHSLALKRDGTVVAWGDNSKGQGTVPEGLSEIVAIAAGPSSNFVLERDGTVLGWGSLSSSSGHQQTVAIDLGLEDVIAISAGLNMTHEPYLLTLSRDGIVKKWGTTSISRGSRGGGWSVEVTMPEVTGAAAVVAGGLFDLAIGADGSVMTFGVSKETRYSFGGTSYSHWFTVVGPPRVPPGLAGVVGVAAVGRWGLALDQNGTVVEWDLWGWNGNDAPEGLPPLVAIEAGGRHVAAVARDGGCWDWLVGNPTVSSIKIPCTVAISRSDLRMLGILETGLVMTQELLAPGDIQKPEGLKGVAVSAGGTHSLVLQADGTVVAWGANEAHQSTVPEGLMGVVAISAGHAHSLALEKDGTVVAWGANEAHQSTVPEGLTGVVAISAGMNHSAALKQDGTVVVWGESVSAPPSGLGEVVAITAGDGFTAALKKDGTVVQW